MWRALMRFWMAVLVLLAVIAIIYLMMQVAANAPGLFW
jgi:hypothetical protein